MNYCPYCYSEASGVGYGDESLDWCSECEILIEGQTLTKEEIDKELEDDE